MNILKENGIFNIATINDRITLNLQARLNNYTIYTKEEIQEIESNSTALFPKDFVVDEQLTNEMRALCMLSQAKLKPARQITSHRKFLGPLIVALKRITFPFIRVHLEDTYKGIEQFNSWMVKSHAQQVLRIKELETALAKTKAKEN